MYKKKFKNLNISPLGMGSLHLPTLPEDPNEIDEPNAQEVIDEALSQGINFIDTAYTYHEGNSEIFLGKALSKYPRESYYLATKFYVPDYRDIEEVFENQLKRLKTDYIDFYMLHGMDENSFSLYTDTQKDYLGYLIEQKRAGRIKYIGFSSHAAPETLSKFLKWNSDFDMAIIQLNYLDWTMLEGKKQYDILTEYNIPVWVMEPLKGGILTKLNKEAAKILKSARPDKSISSWGFRFLMGLPNVQTVLSGMSSIEQIRENVHLFDSYDPLDGKEQETLKRAVEAFMSDLGIPCSACRYCMETCPADLNIPVIIKAYNEKNVSGETWRVGEMNGTGCDPKACIDCKRCLDHCPQKIDIPQIMKNMNATVL